MGVLAILGCVIGGFLLITIFGYRLLDGDWPWWEITFDRQLEKERQYRRQVWPIRIVEKKQPETGEKYYVCEEHYPSGWEYMYMYDYRNSFQTAEAAQVAGNKEAERRKENREDEKRRTKNSEYSEVVGEFHP